MTLAEYMRREKLSDAEFGQKCSPPLHRVQIWHYRTRRRSPRADKVAAIQKATGGMVTAKDMIAS